MIIQPGKIEVRYNKRKPFFTGFSTVGKNGGPYTLTNIELVKRDLLNHFNTPMGSRVMHPDFGTRIYELLFDPFDDYTRNAIMEDVVRVIQTEPRVELVDLDVYADQQALTILITLLFKPEAVTEDLYVTYSIAGDAAT